MSKFEQKNNTGALFVNDKEGNEARPDLRGTVCVNGVMYELSGWKKVSGKGNHWISLSVQEQKRKDVSGTIPDSMPQKHQSSERVARPDESYASGRTPPPDDFDDDIPF